MPNLSSVLSVLLCTLSACACAAEWGTLSMRFVYDGESPQPQAIAVDKDREYCGAKKLLDETLLVNSKDRGVANVVVWLQTASGEKTAVHPDFETKPTNEVEVVFENCRIAPHVALVRTTQTLKIINRDRVAHNPKVDFFNNPRRANSLTIPTTGTLEFQFDNPEASPAHLECSIHPWTSAFIIVRDDPYMAVSDSNGKLTIAKLSVGLHTFRVWQESARFIKGATRQGGLQEWTRGRVTFEIKPGVNDIGELKLSPAIFRP